MSLADLTRNSFQGGIPPAKWINLVKLFLSKNQYVVDVERELSDSVLLLFGSYPGDPTLQSYLRQAIEENVLSLTTFVSTFLSAARTPAIQSPATLDRLCKVALEAHYASKMPPLGSIVPLGEAPINILAKIHDAMLLLKMAFTFPTSDFHHLTLTASELLLLLYSCASDFSQLSTGQAMSYFTDTADLLQVMRISPALRQGLEAFALSLSLVLADDAKVAREAQMMHPIQMSLGNKVEPFSITSENDTVTFSLFFHHLLLRRANDYGCGDGSRPVATLVALIRWMSWPPARFYTQTLVSCATCLAHAVSAGDIKHALMWRTFFIGRLPQLLCNLEKALESEGMLQNDLRQVLRYALTVLSSQVEVLSQCDLALSPANSPESMNEDVERPLLREFLGQCMVLTLIDHTFATSIDSSISIESKSRAHSEAQEYGMNLETYLEGKMSLETSFEDAIAFLDRMRRDYGSHAALAQVIYKRFTTLIAMQEVEQLGHLCKILYTHDGILDVISLHVRIFDFVGAGLAFLEDYDCETVGDPQTALSHVGDVVLFLKWIISTYHLLNESFVWEQRVLHASMLETRQYGQPVGEDAFAFGAWFKALFDSSSEGIDDVIIRSTKPKTLCRISAVLVTEAIAYCSIRKMDLEVLNNGVSYFLGPLLNWTLVGVVKALLREIKEKGFVAPIHIAILETLWLSEQCPLPVLRLCALGVIRVLSGYKSRSPQPETRITNILAVAAKSLGLPDQGLADENSRVESQSTWEDHSQLAVRDALRERKCPCIDMDRCLLVTSPTKFLHMMWYEMKVAASLGNMDVCRRLATHILVITTSTGTMPLLPLFLHSILPFLIVTMDKQQSDHTIEIELLVSVLSSSLAAAFHTEWAWRSIGGEQKHLLGQSSLAMARVLVNDLRKRNSPTSRVISQRLASSPVFAANFPMVMSEL